MDKFLSIKDLIALISDLDGSMQYGKTQDHKVYIRYSQSESWLLQGLTDEITWEKAHAQYEQLLVNLNYYVE